MNEMPLFIHPHAYEREELGHLAAPSRPVRRRELHIDGARREREVAKSARGSLCEPSTGVFRATCCQERAAAAVPCRSANRTHLNDLRHCVCNMQQPHARFVYAFVSSPADFITYYTIAELCYQLPHAYANNLQTMNCKMRFLKILVRCSNYDENTARLPRDK